MYLKDAHSSILTICLYATGIPQRHFLHDSRVLSLSSEQLNCTCAMWGMLFANNRYQKRTGWALSSNNINTSLVRQRVYSTKCPSYDVHAANDMNAASRKNIPRIIHSRTARILIAYNHEEPNNVETQTLIEFSFGCLMCKVFNVQPEHECRLYFLRVIMRPY